MLLRLGILDDAHYPTVSSLVTDGADSALPRQDREGEQDSRHPSTLIRRVSRLQPGTMLR